MPRRRGGGRPARPRPKTDWTYTDDAYSPNTSISIVAGIAGLVGIPLSYSDNAIRVGIFGQAGVAPPIAAWRGGYVVPEGGRNRCHAVEGWLYFIPDTWAVGQNFLMGARLLHLPMDPTTGQALVTTQYSLHSATTGHTPAEHANSGFLKEWLIQDANIAGTAVTARGAWLLRIQWRSAKGITFSNDRALIMAIESRVGSIGMRVIPRLRSLWSTQ